MPSGEMDKRWVERVLGTAIAGATTAAGGFQNRTDMISLDGGDRMVLQRYRRRADAEYRLEVMGALRDPAAAVGIAISKGARVRS